MIWYILAFLFLWALKFIPRKESSSEVRIVVAILYPFLVFGLAFLWNIWARNLIGWPEITNFKELILAIVIF